jgi:predicted transcriptional regulator
MVRALVTFNSDQLKKIDRLARKTKQSRAALMREAVAMYLNTKGKKESWAEIVRKTAGILKGKIKNTDAYLDELRSEWER